MKYYAVVLLLRPHIYYAVNPSFKGKVPATPRKIVSAQGGVVIVNHCAIINSPRTVNLLQRSIFSTAGSFRKRCDFDQRKLKGNN